MKDYFVCHAGADRETFVRPVISALEGAGMSLWVDEAEVLVGDSLIRKVSDGMAAASYVLAVLTPSFVERPWPEYELETAFGRQAARGHVRVVPLTHGLRGEDLERLVERFPVLEGIRRLRWEDGAEAVVGELERRLSRQYTHHWEHHHPGELNGPVWVRVIGAASAADRVVDIELTWGVWETSWHGVLPGGRGPLIIRHHKAVDTHPKKLNLDATSDGERCDVFVQFGAGVSPGSAEEPVWRRRPTT